MCPRRNSSGTKNIMISAHAPIRSDTCDSASEPAPMLLNLNMARARTRPGSCSLGMLVMSASACTPDPVRKVPAAHKLQLTMSVAPASPLTPHYTRATRTVASQSPGEGADLTPSRKLQPGTSCNWKLQTTLQSHAQHPPWHEAQLGCSFNADLSHGNQRMMPHLSPSGSSNHCQVEQAAYDSSRSKRSSHYARSTP
jgi:hypothetical protein